jgi:two-component system NtrC family sensor kinase
MSSCSCAEPARLLIIDDNPSIHNDVRKILSVGSSGDDLLAMEAALFNEQPADVHGPSYRIDSADHGRQGVEMARQAIAEGDPYVLAIVDMRMPGGWDGLQTIEHLWQIDHHVQTLICTAYSDYSWSEICQRLGETDRLQMLKKPFGTQEFQQLIETLTHRTSESQATEGRDEAPA